MNLRDIDQPLQSKVVELLKLFSTEGSLVIEYGVEDVHAVSFAKLRKLLLVGQQTASENGKHKLVATLTDEGRAALDEYEKPTTPQ